MLESVYWIGVQVKDLVLWFASWLKEDSAPGIVVILLVTGAMVVFLRAGLAFRRRIDVVRRFRKKISDLSDQSLI